MDLPICHGYRAPLLTACREAESKAPSRWVWLLGCGLVPQGLLEAVQLGGVLSDDFCLLVFGDAFQDALQYLAGLGEGAFGVGVV